MELLNRKVILDSNVMTNMIQTQYNTTILGFPKTFEVS